MFYVFSKNFDWTKKFDLVIFLKTGIVNKFSSSK